MKCQLSESRLSLLIKFHLCANRTGLPSSSSPDYEDNNIDVSLLVVLPGCNIWSCRVDLVYWPSPPSPVFILDQSLSHWAAFLGLLLLLPLPLLGQRRRRRELTHRNDQHSEEWILHNKPAAGEEVQRWWVHTVLIIIMWQSMMRSVSAVPRSSTNLLVNENEDSTTG